MQPNRRRTVLRSGGVLVGLSLVVLTALAGTGSAQSQLAPTSTSEPRITGTPLVGSKLTASKGTWTGSPTAFDYQWTRCPATGGAADASNCAAISGATTQQFVPGKAEIGKRLRVRVTATNDDGARTVASNATAIIKDADALANTTPPTTVVAGTATGVAATPTAAAVQRSPGRRIRPTSSSRSIWAMRCGSASPRRTRRGRPARRRCRPVWSGSPHRP